jgi:hypothetical protein
MVLRNAGIQPKRPADVLHRVIVPPRLVSDQPQPVEGFMVVRMRLEHLPIQRLRLRKAPGLVVLQGRLKCVRER